MYAIFAALWILLSDKAVALVFTTAAQITAASLLKGWLFVAVTTALLFVAVRRLLDRVVRAGELERQALVAKGRAQRLVETIADTSNDAIFAKDLEGRYLICNRETARVIGRPVHAAPDFDDHDIFPAEQAAALRANDLRVIAADRVITCEETVTTVDGERIYLATKGPLRDADGRVFGIFGISRDIT
ncbi:MAG: PAS domain-containing protein, partial [Deltaproteobacteria bacterium]|nr:PAS domain-containing protein [Deltaproteobacteria bacterium]